MDHDSRGYGFEGATPDVHGNAHVSREAVLVGDVTVGSNATVWPGAVLRGDVAPVSVGERSSVLDNVSVHASTVGDRVMVGNGSVLNDATIGDGTLVGFNATVSNAEIGPRSIVATGAVVQREADVPEGSFAYGHPAQTVPLERTSLDVEGLFERYNSGDYSNLAARHDRLFE